MLSRDGHVVLALLAALSMLLVPLLPMHGAGGTAWASNDSHCISPTQTEKGSTGTGGACGHCCAVAFASALPTPSSETIIPTAHVLLVQRPSAAARMPDSAVTLRPRVRAPPSYG